MSDYFSLEATPGHIGVDFNESFEAELERLKLEAENVGAKKTASFPAEVEYLSKVIIDLREELPQIVKAAGWPAKYLTGPDLDELVLMFLKDPAREARGRGTNASAKAALEETP